MTSLVAAETKRKEVFLEVALIFLLTVGTL